MTAEFSVTQGFYGDSFTVSAAKQEKQDAPYRQYDTSAARTSELLKDVLEGVPLLRLTKQLKNQLGQLNGLDLMGQGSRLVELGVDSGLAVSLDFDKEKMQKNIDRSRLKFFASDVNDPRTWTEIEKLGQYGLIMCTAGEGAIYAWGMSMRDMDNNFVEFIDRSVHLLPPSGVMLVESMSDGVIASYVGRKSYKMHDMPLRIVSSSMYDTLKIVRKADSESEIDITIV